MESIISLKPNNCKDCYKCIRNCPVKAISFADNQAQIIDDECILCGRCFVVCPQNAKQIRNDISRVKDAVRSGKRVVASLAPSFLAAFDVESIEDMRETLKAIGFSDAEETALGAQMVSHAYDKMLLERRGQPLISSCCPSVNSLIQKYYPELLGCLAHVLTPMQAHCKAIKEKDPDAYTVFIGPCVAKKREGDETKNVDACLTFDEIYMWLEQSGQAVLHSSEQREEGKLARFYPTTGGILKTMRPNADVEFTAIDGIENCMSALDEIRKGSLKNVFIEMSACEGGCVAGPILREHGRHRLSGILKVNRYAGEGSFDVKDISDISASLPPTGLKRVMPGGEAINEVLRRMGKTSPDKELNCGSCGYPTCRDKAIAVCQGKAEIEMCLPFLKEKAESFSDAIIRSTPNAILVMDENLIVQQVNSAAMRLFRLRSPEDILKAPVVRMLDPTDYLSVVTTGENIVNKCHFIPEYKVYVEETVLYDKQYRILISIMRDVTLREKRRQSDDDLRRQTVEVTDKVIDKQMRVVQEIASLLGETTAETKIALTRLKDAMKHDK